MTGQQQDIDAALKDLERAMRELSETQARLGAALERASRAALSQVEELEAILHGREQPEVLVLDRVA